MVNLKTIKQDKIIKNKNYVIVFGTLKIVYDSTDIITSLFNTLEAVSYTHLDVYKRQPARYADKFITCQ